MDGENQEQLRAILAIALVSIVVGGTIDLMMDQPESWLTFHVFFETLMIAGAMVMATMLWLGWWRSARSVEELRQSLAERKEERDAWRSSAEQALEGMGRAIDGQFEIWGLTGAEREVALLLLKGHSHKAIAKHTGRSPQTVRQHAAAVYKKGDLRGRAELSAFFLEDLMLPEGREEPRSESTVGP
ncbi:MAG: helix-turn-helix transcriptional regulator [Gemmatimonadota bacterium]|jgi:DNA-binding CsgD family transcriptional regulator